MVTPSQVEFTQLAQQLNTLSRRDITQGMKLAKYKKSARSMLKKDPIAGNTLLGLIACLEHDITSMHAFHKTAISISESCFSLMFYAASLEKSCLWNESARYALSALDHEPGNLNLLDIIVRIAPLTGRFSLLKRLLAQRQQLTNGVPHRCDGDYEIIIDILSRHGLLEKDLKDVVTAIADALSETDVIVQKFQYDLVTESEERPFIHFRFEIPDQFVASYYEDLIAVKLESVQYHPRVLDAFSYSVENSTVYELYSFMEKEMEESADTIRVPDPDKMKLIEELIEGVEI